MKTWLKENDTEIYSTLNNGKSVAAERRIKPLKNIISISKNLYIEKLKDIVNKYNNTYHRTVKMKPVDVLWNSMINFLALSYKNTKNIIYLFIYQYLSYKKT